ncbi:MAG: hypothetical protein MZV70_10525 [Desulfobacterales bacterium]|nr:hypothetical protein [Desulfobacterales bacterium]
MQDKAGTDIYFPKARRPDRQRVQAGGAATVRERQRNQQQRIRQGIDSGELDAERGRSPRSRPGPHPANEGTRWNPDGQVTGAERQKLDSMQDRSSRQIYRQKHDAQSASGKEAIALRTL